MSLIYNESSKESILEFARRLENSTVGKVLELHRMYHGVYVEDWNSIDTNEKEYAGKGGFGQYLEEVYFGKPLDSRPQADFEKAGLELKTAPLKVLKNGSIKAKERVVLGIINYDEIIHETFESSSILEKNLDILFVFFIYDAFKEYSDLKITLVDIWNCMQEDATQIRQDWESIVKKVIDGKAHEISEGDTLFLGASTKGSTKAKSQVTQPNSEIMAQQRAFGFKIQYVNHIYSILSAKKSKRESKFLRVVNDPSTTLEEIINASFGPFFRMKVDLICARIGLPYSPSTKQFYASITKKILGVGEGQEIYEFEAANIKTRTIRLGPTGRNSESISFRAIQFEEIVEQEWEDSDFYVDVTSKFLFVIFKKDSAGSEYYLKDAFLWNMPAQDLEIVKNVWLDTQNKIRVGIYTDFIKISDNQIAHVRPHGKNAEDKMLTPQGTMESKKSFWLNQRYIMDVINQHAESTKE